MLLSSRLVTAFCTGFILISADGYYYYSDYGRSPYAGHYDNSVIYGNNYPWSTQYFGYPSERKQRDFPYYRLYGSYNPYSRRYLSGSGQSQSEAVANISGATLRDTVRDFDFRNPINSLNTLPSLTSVLSDLREASRITALLRLKLEPYYRMINRVLPVSPNFPSPYLRSLYEGAKTMKKAGILGPEGAIEDFVQRSPVDQSKLEGASSLMQVIKMVEKLNADVEATRLMYSSGYSSSIKDSTNSLIDVALVAAKQPRDYSNWASVILMVKQLKQSVALLELSWALTEQQLNTVTTFVKNADKFIQDFGDLPVDVDGAILIDTQKSLKQLITDARNLDGLRLSPKLNINGLELTDMMKPFDKDATVLHIKTKDGDAKLAELNSIPPAKVVPVQPIGFTPFNINFNMDELTDWCRSEISSLKTLYIILQGVMREAIPAVLPTDSNNAIDLKYNVKIINLESALDSMEEIVEPLSEMKKNCRAGCNGWNDIGSRFYEEYPNLQANPSRRLQDTDDTTKAVDPTEPDSKKLDVPTNELPDSIPLNDGLEIYGIKVQGAFDSLGKLPMGCSPQKIAERARLLEGDALSVIQGTVKDENIEQVLDPVSEELLNNGDIDAGISDPVCMQKQLTVQAIEEFNQIVREIGAVAIELARADNLDAVQLVQTKFNSLLNFNQGE